MRSLFRSIFPDTESDAPSAPSLQDSKAAASAASEAERDNLPDAVGVSSHTPENEIPDGMIPASALPSAAHVLADLFPEAEADTTESDGYPIEMIHARGEEAAANESTCEVSERNGADSAPADESELQVSNGDASEDRTPDAHSTTEAHLPYAHDNHHAPVSTKVVGGVASEMENVTDGRPAGAVSSHESTGPETLDISELIDREVAAARSLQASQTNDSDAAFEPAGEAIDAIPVDSTVLPLDGEGENETEILSIDLAKRAVDAVTKETVSPLPVSAGSHTVSAESSAGPAPVPPVGTSDWALEERLACHKEWAESRGISGSKANLACAKLENAELIGVNLRYADLQDSNLRGADLLLADLRDACLVRANLQESCLVGANLEGANLERATLDTAMGLVPRQLAGANLHGASLPSQISEFEARADFARASQMASRFFSFTMVICAVSTLMIWQTKDLQLLANSAILRFLRSLAAAAALPTAQIYLIAPVVVFILYLVFQFHLQTLWDAVQQLPAVFPDGRELGQNESRIVRGLLRAHFRWMNRDTLSTQAIERIVALLLAYWVAPVTLFLFWARYLTLQDLHGTTLHLSLVVGASGVALYCTTKVGRPQERWSTEVKQGWPWFAAIREINPWKTAAGLGVVLLFLSAGTIKGVPHDKGRAPQYSAASVFRWAPTVFWSLGYDPYADLTEASISRRPANWTGSDDDISAVAGAKLSNTKFRYAQAYGVFLVNAHLWRSNFQGAFLSDADLRGADLGQSVLRYAIMDRARLYHANLDRGSLDGANLNRADFRGANLSYCSIEDAILIDVRFEGATLYGARLNGSSMERANLEKSDLRSAHLDNANLDHADMQQAYLWSAKLPGAVLTNAQLGSAILIDADLHNTDLRGAQLAGTVLSGANLAGANIEGSDLRGALGLLAPQICATKSRDGAILTDSLAAQVQTACGGPLLAAPAPVQPAASTPTPHSVPQKTVPQVPVQKASAQTSTQKPATENPAVARAAKPQQ